jgi:hypothetical protein
LTFLISKVYFSFKKAHRTTGQTSRSSVRGLPDYQKQPSRLSKTSFQLIKNKLPAYQKQASSLSKATF